jgi:3-dehydroquinate dehydratase-2
VGVLSGPNLNMLGTREPDLYGSRSYDELVHAISEHASALDLEVDAFQSNHEGELVGRLQAWSRDASMIGAIVNPGGLTHTSDSLRDAVQLLSCPVVEVHLTNIAAREPFRRRSVMTAVCRGVVSGLGIHGYIAALDYLAGEGARTRGALGRAGADPPHALAP